MACKPQSLAEYVSKGQNYEYDDLIGVLVACSNYAAVTSVTPLWQDLPQVIIDAEMIRSTFFERFNFPRENTHILVNPT